MHPARLESEDILYREDGLLAVNKPAGVPVHGSRILADRPGTLLAMVRAHTGSAVYTVHRLDRPVSGVMLLAENSCLQAQLGQIFANRQVEKCYLAVVRGWPEKTATVVHPLRPPRDERKASSIAKEAVTRFERIAKTELPVPVAPYPTARYSLLALFPETGRRHQLRMHMKHLGHPLVGDTSYGRGEHNRMFRERFGCRRLLLHAWSLEFRPPDSTSMLRLEAPLDESFAGIVGALGWTAALANWRARQSTPVMM